MIRRFTSTVGVILAFTACAAIAAATLSPKPQGAEIAFVNSISKDLNARFATPADAIKAGYFRYTNEDKTGAISYANLQWQSSDPQHPSQLWYSAKGKLLGADFSVLQSNSPKRPSLWGVNPLRWDDFDAHVHFILAGANGQETYGATSVKKFTAAGGDIASPTAAAVVKLGKAKDVAAVKKVFLFPHIWDLIVWVTPNPSGAFAEANPLVKPTKTTSDDSM
ncbi:MAG TPA: hypothetical protein VNF68_12405 [Candidatus Baltobacteraceae bacterium]|nr:hypothetical protein [Candidatus Baltobacteraceae bacterium]